MSVDVFSIYLQVSRQKEYDRFYGYIWQGFFAGYYSRAKKPKDVSYFINKIEKARNGSKHVNEVDVDTFIAREQSFWERREYNG